MRLSQAAARWCPTDVVDGNRRLDSQLHERWPSMDLQKFKTLKTIVVSLGVAAVAGLSIAEGGEPTTVGLASVITIALVAGVELGELAAAAEAVRSDGADDTDESDGDG
jgi:hypothetical protein